MPDRSQQTPTAMPGTEVAATVRLHDSDWWRGGVLYQIYPRSFQDSNGDGIGDLPGVTQRIPYLAQLGVDGLWLSPFFKSPMKDFGYDISDYREVDPIFGTLEDFDTVVRVAHQHGLKVLIDQVLSHCSDQHPWFAESRSSRDNPRADWFVWANPKNDGTPPNNWLSIFGGSAWQWDARRRQYYLHNFLAAQPDLNFHNPAVQEAALDAVRFWLDRGVDGFRLDVINFCFHDAQLRDNPSRGEARYDPAINTATPYAWQVHQYDKTQPENLDFLRRLRALLNTYQHIGTVGEIGADDTLACIAEYTSGGDKLHMAYGFDLLGPRCDARYLHDVMARFEAAVTDGWACWSLSNHDVTRVATRWQPDMGSAAAVHPDAEANAAVDPTAQGAWLRLIFILQLSLRGSPCIYQGDELGLTEATLAYDDLQDPVGLALWPEVRGRDGCRTPMVWDSAAPQGGFSSTSATWLPMAPEHLPLAALDQTRIPGSLFNFYREALTWRHRHPVLRNGDMALLPVDDRVLAFVRSSTTVGEQALLCAFNLSADPVIYTLANDRHPLGLIEHPLPAGRCDGSVLHLPPFGAVFAAL